MQSSAAGSSKPPTPASTPNSSTPPHPSTLSVFTLSSIDGSHRPRRRKGGSELGGETREREREGTQREWVPPTHGPFLRHMGRSTENGSVDRFSIGDISVSYIVILRPILRFRISLGDSLIRGYPLEVINKCES
jgi:hypothetical protein